VEGAALHHLFLLAGGASATKQSSPLACETGAACDAVELTTL
jgi:hypothetical protein